MDSVAVLCTIGSDEMVVHNESFSTCPDINDSLCYDKNSLDHKILFVFIFSGLLLCATFLTLYVLIWKKRQCSSQTTFSRIEDSGAHSTRSTNCCIRIWKIVDNDYGEESELNPLLGSYSDTTHDDRCYNTSAENQIKVAHTSNTRATVSAQKDKDVTTIVYHGIGHDAISIQILITNYKINIAFLRKDVLRLKAFRYVSNMPIKEGQSMTVRLYGPAQKEKDVINMVNYAKLFDKNYAEKLASDELINRARVKKTIPRLKSRPSINFSSPLCTNISDVDVLKGSS
ncbi:uncharacterized protein [Mytilus edulis]|uniref:uncharacterized protein n=1 Tax=Mytilus edulis TaxID=6550 RepID=UPI0039EF901C